MPQVATTAMDPPPRPQGGAAREVARVGGGGCPYHSSLWGPPARVRRKLAARGETVSGPWKSSKSPPAKPFLAPGQSLLLCLEGRARSSQAVGWQGQG